MTARQGVGEDYFRHVPSGKQTKWLPYTQFIKTHIAYAITIGHE